MSQPARRAAAEGVRRTPCGVGHTTVPAGPALNASRMRLSALVVVYDRWWWSTMARAARPAPLLTRRPQAMPSSAGALVTETLAYDGGRQVTAYVPPEPPQAVVFAGDGQLIAQWGAVLHEAAT